MQSMNVLPFEDRGPTDMRPTGVRPEFYTDAVLDQGASTAAGRPIWHEREFVKIIIPGVVTNVHVKIVGELEKQRWPREYEAFRAGLDQPLSGTPLAEWPVMTRAMVRELAHWEIRTVEELANLNDQAVQTIGMGGRVLRDRAKAYLDDAEREQLNSRLAHENELLQNRVAALESQVGELGQLLTRIDAERRVLADRPHPYAVMTAAQSDPLAQLQLQPPPIAVESALDAAAAWVPRQRRPAPETPAPEAPAAA